MEELEGVKISQLPIASQINDSDVIPGVVGGQTMGVKASLLKEQKNLITVTEFNQIWKES